MLRAQAPRQRADDIMVGSALALRLDDLARELQMGVSARGINIVVL